jgi:nitrogen fixation NifU-like protein
MQLDNLYQEVILDHYKNPQHKKLNPSYDAQVHHINPSCGDEITLNVTLDGELVKDVSWDGVGCSISQASVSILTDLLSNRRFIHASDAEQRHRKR